MTATEFREINEKIEKLRIDIKLSNVQSQTMEYLSCYMKLKEEIKKEMNKTVDDDATIDADQLYENAYLLQMLIENFCDYLLFLKNPTIQNCVLVLQKINTELEETIKLMERELNSFAIIKEKNELKSKMKKSYY